MHLESDQALLKHQKFEFAMTLAVFPVPTTFQKQLHPGTVKQFETSSPPLPWQTLSPLFPSPLLPDRSKGSCSCLDVS